MRHFLVLCLLSLLTISLAQTPQAPEGYSLEPIVTDLRGPTQMAFGPDGRLWLAQLAGGENAGTGEVVAIDLKTGEQDVLLRGLSKPTGLALVERDLWLMAGNRLLRAPLTAEGVGKLETVLHDLPNNGRSLGTLTLTPEGDLLYETSGVLSASGAVRDSGVLWRLEPSDPTNPERLATGLKGAYAHAFGPDGTLYTTELGDDWMNGGPPPDELNVVETGAAYGWPKCYGRQLPARNTGGTPQYCGTTLAPLALFDRGATPTSVVASPFGGDELLVALWARAEVVEVDAQTGEVTPFLRTFPFPQHLLADGDTLLVSSFTEGTIYRMTAQGAE